MTPRPVALTFITGNQMVSCMQSRRQFGSGDKLAIILAAVVIVPLIGAALLMWQCYRPPLDLAKLNQLRGRHDSE